MLFFISIGCSSENKSTHNFEDIHSDTSEYAASEKCSQVV